MTIWITIEHSRWANSLSGTESVQQNECIFRKNGNDKKFRSYRDLFDHVNNGGINGGGGPLEIAKLSFHCLKCKKSNKIKDRKPDMVLMLDMRCGIMAAIMAATFWTIIDMFYVAK